MWGKSRWLQCRGGPRESGQSHGKKETESEIHRVVANASSGRNTTGFNWHLTPVAMVSDWQMVQAPESCRRLQP
ncbi:MAG: hypothetical protein AAFP90_08560 [Planctomycetota bacterium]